MPQTFLLQILAGINPPNNISLYLGAPAPADPLSVNVGDEVGFFVQALLPNGRVQPPYSLSFDNASFFGVKSLDVPAGGTSPFLRVLSLLGNCKYTVNVTGLGTVVDPEIQSGGGGLTGLPKAAAAADQFVVTWDVLGGSVAYTRNGLPVPFSTQVVLPATVEFLLTDFGASPPENFTVTFATNLNPPTHWETPFDPSQPTFTPQQNQNPAVIGPLNVGDNVDKKSAFPFTASVTVNGQSYTLPNTGQPEIQL